MYTKTKLFLLVFLCTFLTHLTQLHSDFNPVFDGTPVHEAFVAKFTDPLAPPVIPRQPPAPVNEQKPPQPSPDTIWIQGYWAWIDAKADFSWVCGVWRRPPPNQFWIPGLWVQNQGGWSWARGFWSPNPADKITLINVAPPNAIDDKVPASPGKNHFWIPGYWEFSFSTKQYTWLSGKWNPFNENWVLAPASYVWRPHGYVFSPIYWDFPLEARGNAYSCSGPGAAPVIIEPSVIIEELFLCYPDYITFYWHWWYYHPGWWGDCWCLPPWWWWSNWWSFPWGDLWGLWWWWGHPGFLPPFWVVLELSEEIAPPPIIMVDAFKKFPKPPFDYTPGNDPLLPKGPKDNPEPTRPHVPNDVTPGGQVTPPSFPTIPPRTGGQVTPPPPPPPPTTTTPPQYQPTYPTQPRQPTYPTQPYYPPENVNPPTYYPPSYQDQPPGRRPPPRTPPSGNYPNWNPPSGKRPPTVTPPSTTYPRTPPSTQTPNWNTSPNFPSGSGSRYTPPQTRTPGQQYPNYKK